eukprot:1142461-Pelagomonas_calceolata.AAC.3
MCFIEVPRACYTSCKFLAVVWPSVAAEDTWVAADENEEGEEEGGQQEDGSSSDGEGWFTGREEDVE